VADPDKLTAALAVADQQMQLAGDSLARLLQRARQLLTVYGVTETWSILSSEIRMSLDLDTRYQRYAGEMLAAAVLRLVDRPETPDSVSD
jgi:hypothetical protein